MKCFDFVELSSSTKIWLVVVYLWKAYNFLRVLKKKKVIHF